MHSVACVGNFRFVFLLRLLEVLKVLVTLKNNNHLGCLISIYLRIDLFCMQFSMYIIQSLLRPNGDNEIRTRDLLLARQALSQLSYTPILVYIFELDGLKWTRTTDLTLIRRAL